MTEERNGMGIYLDHAATSFPKAPGVAEAMAELVLRGAVNVGRGGYEQAYDLMDRVIDTRDRLKRMFHAPEEYAACFTGGATQGINQFLKGLLHPGDHVVVSSVEHNAVMRPLHTLEQAGVEVSIAVCDREGKLKPEAVEEAIRPNTKAVLMSHASNVCGTILPVREIAGICHDHSIWFGVDAAQTAGILPIDMCRMGIDFLNVPGHKGLLGPQGVGAFIVSPDLAEEMNPLIEGGTGSSSDSEEQPDFLPDKFESGTLPLVAIIGLNAALRFLDSREPEQRLSEDRYLTGLFLEGLMGLPVRVAGIANPARTGERTGVISVDFSPLDNGIAAFSLEQDYGIMTRVGLHCAPRAHKTLGTFPEGTVRFSLGYGTTEEDIRTAIRAVQNICSGS